MDPKTTPPIVETDDLPKKRLDKFYKPPTAELIAYLDFNVSTTGVLSGVKVCACCLVQPTHALCVHTPDVSRGHPQHVPCAQARG